MVEMLVLHFCLQDLECNMLTKAYLAHNAKLKQDVRNFGKKVQRTDPELGLLTVITYGSLAAQKFRTRLPYNTILEWKFKDNEQKTVTIQWRYDF